MAQLLEQTPKTTFRPDMRIMYEFVRDCIIDGVEGRGEFWADLKRLNQMVGEVPEISKLVAKGHSDRRLWIALNALSNPETLRFRTLRDVEDHVYSAVTNLVGEESFEDSREELQDLADAMDACPNVNAPIIATHIAHEFYESSALAILEGLVRTFKWIGECAGKTAVYVDPAVIDDLKRMRLEIIRGYSKRSIEEKNLIQAEVILPYAVAHEDESGITMEQAQTFIRSCIKALKWAYITLIDPAWAKYDAEAALEFTEQLSLTFAPAAKYLERKQEARQLGIIYAKLTVKRPGLRFPFQFYIADKRSWMSDSDTITMMPLTDMPFLSGQRQAAVSMFLAPPGSGKTTAMFSLAFAAVERGAIVTSFMGDSTNQGCYLCLPALGDEMESVIAKLEEMEVKPTPMPLMILDVITRSQRELLQHYPITKYDRVIEVESTRTFNVDFADIIREADKIREQSPLRPKPRGVAIFARFLDRKDPEGKFDEELAVCWNLNRLRDQWRRRTGGSRPVVNFFDELYAMIPRTIYGRGAGQDKSAAMGQINDMLTEARRLNMAVIGSTQHPTDLIGAPIAQATNVFLKNLTREDAEHLLKKGSGVLQFPAERAAERDRLLSMNDSKAFGGNFCWAWWSDDKREAEVVEACPPPTYLQLTTEDRWRPYELYDELYEKETGESILVDWKDIDWDAITIARGRESSAPTAPWKDMFNLDLGPSGQL